MPLIHSLASDPFSHVPYVRLAQEVRSHMLFYEAHSVPRVLGVGIPLAWLTLACPKVAGGFTLVICPRQIGPPELLRAPPPPHHCSTSYRWAQLKSQLSVKTVLFLSKSNRSGLGIWWLFFFFLDANLQVSLHILFHLSHLITFRWDYCCILQMRNMKLR